MPVSAAPSPARNSGDVLVFAAASLQTALDELSAPIQKATGARIRISYAASSTLARQIENGAPAQIFIAADLDWMDYVATRNLIRKETRVNLMGNQLVLIAPSNSGSTLKISQGFGLAQALGRERLAMADPVAAPAGKYGREALTKLGVWNSVSTKIAQAENVRAALLLVSRGEAPFGIVYRTDALIDRGVKVLDTFPESTHAPIVYPAALTSISTAEGAKVLEFLKSAAARAAFEKAGFTPARN
jgi:molybdate transport system substrate-binding protein